MVFLKQKWKRRKIFLNQGLPQGSSPVPSQPMRSAHRPASRPPQAPIPLAPQSHLQNGAF